MPDSKVEVKAVPVYVEEALCKWFSEAPCFLCGYNGEGYYQPNAHSCAKHYHSMTLSKLWNTRPIANNGVSLEDILNILVEEDYKSYLEMDKKLGSIQWTSKPDKETILAMSRERLTPSAIAIHAKLPTTAINNGVSFEDIEKIIWKHCTPLYEEDIQGHTHTLKGNELAKAIHAKLQPTAPSARRGGAIMKTLGDLKGLLPERKITQQYDDFNNGFESGENHMIDIVSAIPLLDVVKKAVESGAVRIKLCSCIEISSVFGKIKTIRTCANCYGHGFTITEGEVSCG